MEIPGWITLEDWEKIPIKEKVDAWIQSAYPGSLLNPSSRSSADPFIPKFPLHPKLGEIGWGPLPTAHEYKLAHRLWSLPNATLEYYDLETQQNYPESRNRTKEFLTRNVYADLVDGKHQHYQQPFAPRELSNKFPNAHAPFDAEGWEYEYLGELAPAKRQVTADDAYIAGRNKKARWLKQELLDELANRNRPRDKKATVNELKDELFASQANHENDLNNQVGIYPRHGLEQWGIEQRGHVDSCADADYEDTGEDYLSPFRLYTWALHLSPYNPTYWVSRAYLFHQKGYYDLALGDAYRACFLSEVLHNGATISGLYARVWDAIEQHVYANAQNPYIPLNDFNIQKRINAQASAALDLTRSPEGLLSFVPHLRRTIHHIISLNLLSSQAWVDWWKMDTLAYKLQREDEYAQPFLSRLETNQGHDNRRNERQKDDLTLWKHERSAGSVSGKGFLQSAKDVDRTAKAFLAMLNAKFFGPWPGKKDPTSAIEVRRKADGELGVFALRAFEQNELIHIEEPSVRGQVREASHRPDGNPQPASCENCKRPVSYGPRIDAEWSRLDESERDQHQNVCRCIDAEPPRYFCQHFRPEGLGITGIDLNHQQPMVSIDEDEQAAIAAGDGSSAQAPKSRASKRKATDDNEMDQPPTTRTTRSGNRPTKTSKSSKASTRTKKKKVEPPPEDAAVEEPEMTCLRKARETYHFKSCGKEWEWLHRQLRPTEPAHPGGHTEANSEEHGTLLSCLLLDVFDRTLLLRTQQPNSHILAHEIDELLPLFSGDDLSEQHFPFTYSANIVVPFDILLNLGVNIFRELDFDTWVIQTVLRKLLLNCLPWDEWHRGEDDNNKTYQGHGSFETLYVHTGFAMFNHACMRAANSQWSWDQWTEEQPHDQKGIPNRIIMKASRAIAVDEEIKIQYYPGAGSRAKQRRLFGHNCDCGQCPESPGPR